MGSTWISGSSCPSPSNSCCRANFLSFHSCRLYRWSCSSLRFLGLERLLLAVSSPKPIPKAGAQILSWPIIFFRGLLGRLKLWCWDPAWKAAPPPPSTPTSKGVKLYTLLSLQIGLWATIRTFSIKALAAECIVEEGFSSGQVGIEDANLLLRYPVVVWPGNYNCIPH